MHALQTERRRRQSQDEEGFTLIELLIVLVIMPLVVGAIAMVLITTLKNDQRVDGTVVDSSAATLSSEYYVRDVESASAVTTTSSPGSPSVCSAAGLSGSTTFLMGLQLQATTAGTAASESSYYEWTPGAGPPELVREFCIGGSSTPLSHEVLSDNLSATNPPVAVVPCASPPPTSIPTNVTCTPATSWTPTYMVSTISLNVTQGCSIVGSCAPYQYGMSGDPQSGVPIPPISQPCGVLTLLGSGIDINMTASIFANESLNVQGPIALNSGYNTSGGGNAAINSIFTLFGSESVSGTGATCANGSTVSNNQAIGIYNCNNTSSTGSSTNNTPCPTSGTHTTINNVGDVTPGTPVQISTGASQTGLTDPLLAWANQTTFPTVSGSQSCPPATVMNCQPGVYAAAVTIPNNATVTFASGNYVFNGSVNCSGTTTSLCIQSNDKVNFGSGAYEYANGIDVSGSGNTLCGTTTASSACSTALASGKGVFFYVKGGTTDLGNSNSGTTFQLSACTTSCFNASLPNSNYQDVVLWQDGGDNNQVFLSGGNNNVANSLGGAIYAPTAQIEVYGWSGFLSTMTVNTDDIVANTLAFSGTFSNNVTVTVSSVALP